MASSKTSLKHNLWYSLAEDGYPPEIADDEGLIVSDAHGEIRAAYHIAGCFVGYIVEPVTHWMIISKPEGNKNA